MNVKVVWMSVNNSVIILKDLTTALVLKDMNWQKMEEIAVVNLISTSVQCVFNFESYLIITTYFTID